ncbi:unnamed protein product, partial [marine sediment metagenome]
MTTLYIFLDESGNYDFSKKGTEYLCYTAVTTFNPNQKSLIIPLNKLKYELISGCLDIEFYHASEDRQVVRNEVFNILSKFNNFDADSILIEKRKTNPILRSIEKIYPKIYECLLRYIYNRYKKYGIDNLIIIIDSVPIKKKREVCKKALKDNLKKLFGKEIKYKVLHHTSKSNYYLQIAD